MVELTTLNRLGIMLLALALLALIGALSRLVPNRREPSIEAASRRRAAILIAVVAAFVGVTGLVFMFS
jgi:hypothetical protein